MSRIGRTPIAIPTNVEVAVDGATVVVRGPKGELQRALRPEVEVARQDDTLSVVPRRGSRFARALWGTYASHLKNMIMGVTSGFERRLVVEGIGYRVEMQDDAIVLNVGFSHPVRMPVPQTLTVSVEKNVITISGIDKEEVGAFAARVRAVKKPEPYKGKGIRYEDETIRRKQGKKAS